MEIIITPILDNDKKVNWYEWVKCKYNFIKCSLVRDVYLPACLLYERELIGKEQLIGDRLEYYMDFDSLKVDGKKIDDLDSSELDKKIYEFARFLYNECIVMSAYNKEIDNTNTIIKNDFYRFLEGIGGTLNSEKNNFEVKKSLFKAFILFKGTSYTASNKDNKIKAFDYKNNSSDQIYNSDKFKLLSRLLFQIGKKKDDCSFMDFHGIQYGLNEDLLKIFYSILIVNFIKRDDELIMYLEMTDIFNKETDRYRYLSGKMLGCWKNIYKWYKLYVNKILKLMPINVKIVLHFFYLNEIKRRNFIKLILENESPKWKADISLEERVELWNIVEHYGKNSDFFNKGLGEWIKSLDKKSKNFIIEFISEKEKSNSNSDFYDQLDNWDDKIKQVALFMNIGSEQTASSWWIYTNIITARIMLPILKNSDNSKLKTILRVFNNKEYNKVHNKKLYDILNHSINKKRIISIYNDAIRYMPDPDKASVEEIQEKLNRNEKVNQDDVIKAFNDNINDFKYNIFLFIVRLALIGNSYYYASVDSREVISLDMLKSWASDTQLLSLLKMDID